MTNPGASRSTPAKSFPDQRNASQESGPEEILEETKRARLEVLSTEAPSSEGAAFSELMNTNEQEKPLEIDTPSSARTMKRRKGEDLKDGIETSELQNNHRKRKRVRCGECEACTREDCGLCEPCKKMKKFGGDGSCKETCVHRRCRDLKERAPSAEKKRKAPKKAVAPNEEEKNLDEVTEIAPSRRTPSLARSPTTSSKASSRRSRKDSKRKSKSPASKKEKSSQSSQSSRIASSETDGVLGRNTNNDMEFLYGRAIPSFARETCAGCVGKRDEELGSEPIIICDGCDREYHLDCCMPTLTEVPSGKYYCLDCSDKGSSAYLEEYFDRHHEYRANFRSSQQFVKYMIEQKLKEEDDSFGVPMSELERISKLNHDALFFSARYIAKSNPASTIKGTNWNKRKSPKPIQPDFLLGHCVRLYCPIENQYHSGRIIHWRKATHCDQFWSSEVSNIEYLVRFPAGKDFRKTSMQQWLILEEHALAIGVSLIWGLNVMRKGVMGFNPAQTWLRTSLELLPVQAQLSPLTRQIYFLGDLVKSDHPSWALTSFWGEEQYSLLDLQNEAVDYFSPQFAEARFQRQLTIPEIDVRLPILLGLAQVEWEEQQRVRRWQKMPLDSPMHPRALTSRDEAALEPSFRRNKDPRLCPSIQIDFDRQYLLSFMKSRPNRDMAVSMRCELVAPSPRLMKELQGHQQEQATSGGDY